MLGTAPRRVGSQVEIALANRLAVRVGATLEVLAFLTHWHKTERRTDTGGHNLHTKLSTDRRLPADDRPTIELIEKGLPMRRTRAIAFSTLARRRRRGLDGEGVAFAADGRGFGDGFGRHRRGGAFLVIVDPAGGSGRAADRAVARPASGPQPAAPPAPPASPTLNAQAILADRLARGEISPDDYRAAVAVLRETPPPVG